jgi:hypothetical protein
VTPRATRPPPPARPPTPLFFFFFSFFPNFPKFEISRICPIFPQKKEAKLVQFTLYIYLKIPKFSQFFGQKKKKTLHVALLLLGPTSFPKVHFFIKKIQPFKGFKS